MERLADPRMTPEERETLIARADEKLQARERMQKWFEEHPDVFDAIFEDEDDDYEDGDYEEVQG